MGRPIYLHGTARQGVAIAGRRTMATCAETSMAVSRSGKGMRREVERTTASVRDVVRDSTTADNAARTVARGNRNRTRTVPKADDGIPIWTRQGGESSRGTEKERRRNAATLTDEAIRSAWGQVRAARPPRSGPADCRSVVYIRRNVIEDGRVLWGINVVRPWADRLENSEKYTHAGTFAPDITLEDFTGEIRFAFVELAG